MEKEYFLNAEITPPLHFVPSFSQSPMPTWQPLTSAPDPNWSSEQPSNYFLNPNWEKSTGHYVHIESALSSLVSSPASNSAVSSDCFAIRELIGKLGSICNAGDISPSLLAASVAAASYIGDGNNSSNTSCYNTPLNSPPKLHVPNMDHFVKENLPNLGNSMPLDSTLPAVSGDTGFAERAATASCFGSRSFNGRMRQSELCNTEFQYRYMGSGNLQRVPSSPSLEVGGTLMGVQEKKNYAQIRKEMRSANGLVMLSDKKLSKLSGSGANSNEESSVSEQIPCGETGLRSSNDLNSRKRKVVSRGKAKEAALSQSTKATKEARVDDDNSNAKRSKTTDARENENGGVKTVEDTKESSNGAADEGAQANASLKPPESPKDYIHVRARRGQATDSHSLAERVRREKISERMKLLQDIVPGCNKVTGKALMLDEIINYVQSLQCQVEFLSMKLASVDPRLEFNMDSLVSKDILQPNDTLPHPIYPVDSSASAFYGHQPQQNPQLHVDPLDATLCRNLGMQLPAVDGFGEGLPRFPAFCEDDLQSIVQMGLGENPNRDPVFHSQSFPGKPKKHVENS